MAHVWSRGQSEELDLPFHGMVPWTKSGLSGLVAYTFTFRVTSLAPQTSENYQWTIRFIKLQALETQDNTI